jgi:hypothetical protein
LDEFDGYCVGKNQTFFFFFAKKTFGDPPKDLKYPCQRELVGHDALSHRKPIKEEKIKAF